METSASSSSLHRAVMVRASDDPLAGTTGQSANEFDRVSSTSTPVKDLSEADNGDTATNENPGSRNSNSLHSSSENIAAQPLENAGGEIAMNEATDPLSQVKTVSQNSISHNAHSSTGSSKSKEGSRSKIPQVDTVTGLDIGKLVGLMEEQVLLLRLLNERQAASDLSQQPMPEVSTTSNSTWGALLRMTVAETIQPKVDRWRSGLDALLVFLGLFSAIVTAFLVESLSGLRPDEAARTNELLANLTDIMIALSGVNPMSLNLLTPAQFQPDPTDVRLNSYWSLSLILSLSVAALAVTCRGFLNMVTLSRHAKAMDKLIDIKMRWKEADKILGPVIEMTPQLLVIPVLLFVVGLLDTIFSDVLQLAVLPTPVVVTTSLSLFFIAGVVAFLGYSLFDGSVRAHSSPFQSTFASIISTSIMPLMQSSILPLHTSAPAYTGELPQITTTNRLVVKHYHETVQAIHDDDTLDKASAALGSVLDPQRHLGFDPLEEEEVATLVHLLSPEASIRANRTAAAAIAGYSVYDGANSIPQKVIIALVHAARRSVGSASIATLESSVFLAAMVQCIIQVDDPGPEHPPPIQIIGSKYVSLEHEADAKPEVINFVCDIIRSYPAEKSLGINHQPHRMTVVELFQPDTISTSIVLQAFCRAPGFQRRLITPILIEAKTAQAVIQAVFEVVKLLHNNSVQGLSTVAEVAHAALSRGDFSDHELLGDLCVSYILKIMQDANFQFAGHDLQLRWQAHKVVEALAEVPFTEENSTSDLRTVIEFLIETKGLTWPLPTQRTVMGQDMPMSELAQLLNQMAEIPSWDLLDFDLAAAINDIQASRNS
ncbi:hypothetical protein C8J57DRAFT_1501540 [Mycena rebaudengoi]|nr:hypothetical protein C8J57DRAFT_1501540 [Mycena rebaudengoi]